MSLEKTKCIFEAVPYIKPKQAGAGLIWKMQSNSKHLAIPCRDTCWYIEVASVWERNNSAGAGEFYPLEEKSWDEDGLFCTEGC